MNKLHTSDIVRLKEGIAWACLPRHSVGVVQSVWFAPHSAYEVEFQRTGMDGAAGPTRVLLRSDEIELEEDVSSLAAAGH